jgi:two-component system phosphate regulon sensor histidine kinase PhoR
VDAGRSRKLGGSGLGLAIVKHALQRHGATLDIASEEGKGSTFTCHFPAARVRRRDGQTATNL